MAGRPAGSRGRRLWTALHGAAAASAATTSRDRSRVFGLFLLPLVIITLVGIAMRGYSDPVFSVGVLVGAPGRAAEAFVAALAEEPTVRIRRYRDRERMRAAVYRGRLHAAVVIPAGWDGHGDVDLYASAAGVGAVVVRAIAEARIARAVDPGGVRDVPTRLPPGVRESRPPIGFRYTAPSNVVLFVLINGLVSSAGMLALRRQGITRRLLATPARTWEIVALLAVGPAQAMAVQAFFLIGLTALAFGVPWGDPAGVVLVTLALLLVGVAVSLLAGTLFRSPEQAFSLAPLLAIAAGMLGGCMWPLSVAPAWLREAGHALPTAWAMDGYLALVFGREGTAAVLPATGVLLAMALVLGGVGVLRLRGQLAR